MTDWDRPRTPVKREPHWLLAFTFTVDVKNGPACVVVRRTDDASWVATVTALTPEAALAGARAAARPPGAEEI